MSWRTCVVVKQIQPNIIQAGILKIYEFMAQTIPLPDDSGQVKLFVGKWILTKFNSNFCIICFEKWQIL